MTEGKKEGGFNGKWALIVCHPWCPSYSDQIARARAWGLDERMAEIDGATVDLSAISVDDVQSVGRTTNWKRHLAARERWFAALKTLRVEGDRVFFATPLCVGFSAKIAEWTIGMAFDAGLEVYIHTTAGNGPAVYRAGDDMADFYDSVRLAANAAYQAANRARKSGKAN